MNYLGKLNKQIAQSAPTTCLRQTNYSFHENGFLLVNRVFIDFDESHHRTSALIASFSRTFLELPQNENVLLRLFLFIFHAMQRQTRKMVRVAAVFTQ